MASPLKSMALQTRMGGTTTPMTRPMAAKAVAPLKKNMMQPLPSMPAASNTQRDQMARALAKNNKVQQTFGVPGAN